MTGNSFGVVEENHLEVTSFYKHNFSNQYFHGDKRYDFGSAAFILRDSYFDFFGINMGYGITRKLTAEAQLGYFGNKTQNYNNGAWIVGNGLSDLSLSLKYNFFNSKDSVWSMTISPGAKFPTGAYKDYTPEGVKLSRDVQSGSGAYTAMIEYSCRVKLSKKFSIAASTNFEYNGINPEQYQYGYANTNSISSGVPVLKNLTLLVMIKNENHSTDYFYDEEIIASGYSKITGIPGLSYELPREWSVSGLLELPIYQRFNEIQFVTKYAVTGTVSKKFELKKKAVKH